MRFNANRIVEKVEEVNNSVDFEKDEYIMPHIQVTSKQFEKILRSIKKQNKH
jgi:hypothetical protein